MLSGRSPPPLPTGPPHLSETAPHTATPMATPGPGERDGPCVQVTLGGTPPSFPVIYTKPCATHAPAPNPSAVRMDLGRPLMEDNL